MSAANGAGTAFDGTGADSNGGATVLLGAATPVTVGAHSLYLSIFDQGDNALDSAVFLDNLRVASVPNPGVDCTPGATPSAHLTLSKTVDNTAGGTAAATDWTLSATGPTTISGSMGSPEVTNAAVSPGTYTLDESGPAGYSPSGWSCTGGSLTGSSLDLAAGDNATCSITNTSQASGGAAELSADMTDSPDPVSPTAPVRYTIAVHNAGPDTATATTLTGHVPSGADFIASDGCTSSSEGDLDCNLGEIPADADVTTTIDLRAPAAAGPFTFQMFASSPDDSSGPILAEQETTVTNPSTEPDEGGGFATGNGSTTVQTTPDPLQFSVITVPAGVVGAVTMNEFTEPVCQLPLPATCIGQTLDLTAPSATAGKPLVLKILVAKNAVTARLTAKTAVLYHALDSGPGTIVSACAKPTKAMANPTPCLSSVKGVKVGRVAYWQFLVYTVDNGSWRPGIIPR
jgi:uncharacterized repeat protein (TIGR01451 family)